MTKEERRAKGQAWYAANRDRVLARVAAYQAARRKPKPTPEERFWSHVDRSAGPDACWPWMLGRMDAGYGRTRWQGRQTTASRVAYILGIGPIDDAHEACHTCDNPPCCNPGHLFAGTTLVNNRDKVAKGRQTRGDEHYTRCRPDLVLRGDANPRGNARLTFEIADEIRRAAAAGELQRDVAARYAVHQSTVSLIVSGRTWIRCA